MVVAAMRAAARKFLGELVVAGGDAARVLETTPETLDEVPWPCRRCDHKRSVREGWWLRG